MTGRLSRHSVELERKTDRALHSTPNREHVCLFSKADTDTSAEDSAGGRLGYRTLRAWTLLTEVAIPSPHPVVEEDQITRRETTERTHRLGRELALYVGVRTRPDTAVRFPAINRQRNQ